MNRIYRLSHLACATFALTLAACAAQQPAPVAPAAPSASPAARAPVTNSEIPSPPYYSVQLATTDETQVRANFDIAGDADFIRAEKRNGQYALRVGAWSSKADATKALERYKAQGIKDAYVIHCHTQPAFIQP